MRCCALLLALAGLSAAATTQKTFTGVIHDNRCVGPACARQCPATKDPVYTLQSGEDAWILRDAKDPARYVGKKVVVSAIQGPDNKLKVVSIVPAK